MPVQIAVRPNREQMEEFLGNPQKGPVVMVNLLRFHDRATGDQTRSGEDAYRAYATQMRKLVEGRGGRFLWSGRVDSQVMGASDKDFHFVGLVEYPSRAVFLEIASSPEFQAIEGDRTDGLEGQWLIAASEEPLEQIAAAPQA